MYRTAFLIAQAGTIVLALSTGAMAQGAPAGTQPSAPTGQSSPGLGPQTSQPSQVDKGQNMILPSAGASGASAAPTMVYDCKAKPQDCTQPATPADKAGASRTSPIKP